VEATKQLCRKGSS